MLTQDGRFCKRVVTQLWKCLKMGGKYVIAALKGNVTDF